MRLDRNNLMNYLLKFADPRSRKQTSSYDEGRVRGVGLIAH